MTSFSEAMAARVVELEAALRTAKARTRQLERSRNLWRNRALRGVEYDRSRDPWRSRREYKSAA